MIDILFRLEFKKKELTVQKEELLKESKEKQVTYDNVKSQVDKLMKVESLLIHQRIVVDIYTCYRWRLRSRRQLMTSYCQYHHRHRRLAVLHQTS